MLPGRKRSKIPAGFSSICLRLNFEHTQPNGLLFEKCPVVAAEAQPVRQRRREAGVSGSQLARQGQDPHAWSYRGPRREADSLRTRADTRATTSSSGTRPVFTTRSY